MDLSAPGWMENPIYPGKHWLFHNQRRDYVARVDYDKWTGSRFLWRVFKPGSQETAYLGYEDTLEDAQRAAERAMKIEPPVESKPRQLTFWED